MTLLVIRSFPLLAQEPPTPSTKTQEFPPPKPGQIVRPWQPGDPEPKGPMQVVVVEGQDAVNMLKKKVAASPTIEIRDGKDALLPGVAVVFTAPTDGASVTFSNGLRQISLVTDATGRATANELVPIGEGPFQISITATFRSLSANAMISMTNVVRTDDKEAPVNVGASRGGISGKTLGILLGIAGAAAAGAAVAFSHKGAAAATGSVTTATIGVGSGGSVSAPH